MELQTNFNLFGKRPILKCKTPAIRWYKEWVPQDVVSTGGKCFLLKWVSDDTLKALKEKSKEPEAEEPEPEPEPEPTTEVLFLCSYEGCGKTFIDAGALKKHSHIHGERQYVCHYEGCGRKFLDSSKLKRHFLIHTGEKHFVCPHDGCGKAFSLDFNLRAHMRTHSQENYHVCPYVDCGKRYAHEYKLRTHIKAHHEKNMAMDMMKNNPPSDKLPNATKPSAVNYGSASTDRPYACPYEGCDKCYIHEYKLNLHLKREHPGHYAEENGKNDLDNDHEVDEASDQDAYGGNGKNSKRRKPNRPVLKMPPLKIQLQKPSNVAAPNLNMVKKQWPTKEMYEEDDSEETEEDRDNVEDGWRYTENNEDDEETEYED
ncbi:zinc finger transcription factor YY1-like [Macadamia integrifolia]|uniref:zinc finger transcription factor YY1-like n=1 Tax=Macadamia integrifolia TaxID=60698 RepID=UPI001C4E5DFF|nr:zinc finger transcription factor YY1-like [Macadamia integrifolia]